MVPTVNAGPATHVELRDTALAYARAGWPVFPLHTPLADGRCDCRQPVCERAGKHPRTANGHNGASTDPAQIERWWSQWPNANIGVACGPAGWAVLDVDPRHGGDDSYATLIEGYGEATFATATALTGGGGRHCIFRVPAGGLSCTTNLRPGLDVRAAGGYVVVAPSLHASGQRYAWERSPLEHPLLAWPAIPPSKPRPPASSAAGTVATGDDSAIVEGARNARLTKMAGALRRQGATAGAIQAALLAANAQQCRPPLSEAEVAAIAASVARYPVSLSVASSLDQEEESITTRPWPDDSPEPFIGLALDFVDAIIPHSEADPMALLVHFRAAFCTAVGPEPYFLVGTEKHHAHNYFGVVGATSRGRKGTSWSPVDTLFSQAFHDWDHRYVSGLSSGEGLVNAVRDPLLKRQDPSDEFPTAEDYLDEGVPDKRLLVLETELGAVLQQINRSGNILSACLRDAWDDRDLHVLTRKSPLKATKPHISFVGHITIEELQKELHGISAANGFANRFVWVLTRRKRLLANPAAVSPLVMSRLAIRLRDTVDTVRTYGEITRSKDAAQHWEGVYAKLEAERLSGLAGKLVSRSSAHVLRLSLIYALIECSRTIDRHHIDAAVALWEYAEDSVDYIFSDKLGDPIADSIEAALREAGSLTRTEIIALGNRRWPARDIQAALQSLVERRVIEASRESTTGRPAERWTHIAATAA